MELPIAADVSHVVAAELVVERDIEDEVGLATEADALEHQVALSVLPHIPFLEGWDVAPLRRDPGLAAEGVEDGLVCCLGAARVLLVIPGARRP